MAAWLGLTMAVVRGVDLVSPQPAWIPALALFIVASIGQFCGQNEELDVLPDRHVTRADPGRIGHAASFPKRVASSR